MVEGEEKMGINGMISYIIIIIYYCCCCCQTEHLAGHFVAVAVGSV